MNLPTKIALVVIAAFFLFVIFCIIRNKLAGKLKIVSGLGSYKAGDTVDLVALLNLSKPAKLNSAQVKILRVDRQAKDIQAREQTLINRSILGEQTRESAPKVQFLEIPISIALPDSLKPQGLNLTLDFKPSDSPQGEFAMSVLRKWQKRRARYLYWCVDIDIDTSIGVLNAREPLDLKG